jgi:hypothetical protein
MAADVAPHVPDESILHVEAAFEGSREAATYDSPGQAQRRPGFECRGAIVSPNGAK